MDAIWSAIVSYLQENAPWLLVILVAVIITWAIARFFYKRFVKLEERVNSANCAEHSRHITEHSKSILETSDNIKEITQAITVIKTLMISTNNGPIADCFSQKNSPRVLNSFGQKLYDDCNGAKFLEDNLQLLISEIEKRNPLTALDVENEALSTLVLASTLPIFNDLKAFIYASPMIKVAGDKSRDLSIRDICFVISLPLRDKYFEKHPEIEQE